jgi:sensor c-di-GMP phosphodiesterase-like protein
MVLRPAYTGKKPDVSLRGEDGMKLFVRHGAMVSLLGIAGVVLTCAAAGLAIGLIVAAQTTETRLDKYAKRLIHYAEAFNSEINSTLDAVNASPFPFCSDADITRLRTLVFHGHLVKDIGRVRNGTLYCTSIIGRLDPPVPRKFPDIVTPSGREIWLNQPLVSVPGMRGDITQSSGAEFVAAHDAFEHLHEAPMSYTTTLTNRVTRQVLRTAGDPLQLTNTEIFAERSLVRGNTFYVARCSEHFAPCMVAAIALRDAWQTNSSTIGGFVEIGCIAGLALGVTLLLQPRKRSLARQLRRALRRNLITVVYQPIVDVKDGRIVGAEALARWTDEDNHYVRPDIFVAAAEELGFIGKLTRVMLRQIVAELGPFLREHPEFHVNVNIAAADLADPQFMPMLEKLLQKNDIASESIGLELTERSTADQHFAISSIGRLRARGHAFYIDDFGTGYSSLSYLNKLAVDAIKIDRAFTDAVGTGSLTAVIVPQILAMANTLGVKVVVEGVERAEQSEYFANLDQEILAQGWHFGEPVPAQELLTLLASKAAGQDTSVE